MYKYQYFNYLIRVSPSHHYNHMKHILTTCWDSYGIQKSRHFRRLFYFLWLVVFGDLGFDQGSWSSEKSGLEVVCLLLNSLSKSS